jgi:hypothetical protein
MKEMTNLLNQAKTVISREMKTLKPTSNIHSIARKQLRNIFVTNCMDDITLTSTVHDALMATSVKSYNRA